MADKTERATLTSVAFRAGVSRQTVSNVLHTPEVVRPVTRARVQQAISDLGYRPNLAARQMRTSRSQAIAVRIAGDADGVSGVVLERFTHALCTAAEAQSHHLVVFGAESDEDEIKVYERLLSTLNIDGIVVVSTHADDARVNWLVDHHVPFVAFGRPWSEKVEHTWVDVDGAAGTRQATRHLLAQGHRQIAFLNWDISVGTGDDRESGWREEMIKAGLGADLVLRGPDGISAGKILGDQLAANHREITAAVCVSDSLAVGVRQRSLELGRDLDLVGFDNTATSYALGISSVAQPLEEAATHCFSLLYEQLTTDAADRPGHQQLLLEPELKVRSSS